MFKTKTCVTLNSMQSVTNWAINATASPIYVYPISWPPFLTYKEWEINHENNETIVYYQYCGPFILLLRALAQQINIEFRLPVHIKDIISFGADYADGLANIKDNDTTVDVPQMLLFPYLGKGHVAASIDWDMKLSRFIGSLDGDIYISKAFIGLHFKINDLFASLYIILDKSTS